jgi:uncharacterized Tic20 family protein
MKYFRSGLYTFIIGYITIDMVVILTHCNKKTPWGYNVFNEVLQGFVLIVAIIIGPLILFLMKRNSKYLYDKTKLKVRFCLLNNILKIYLSIIISVICLSAHCVINFYRLKHNDYMLVNAINSSIMNNSSTV